ncbi:MAG: hypothetical protein HOV79_24815, partial [Hamadaea sp.]|nr:hypothetical protein [Hamadaea sp.]
AAQAASPDYWAFAYLDDPNPPPGYVTDVHYQSNSVCPWLHTSVTHYGSGVYELRVPCVGGGPDPGVVHVTAVDPKGHYCKVGKWDNSGPDVFAYVFCFDRFGSPDPSRFTFLFSNGPAVPPPGAYAYVWWNPWSGVSSSYNSTGAPNAANPVGSGLWEVYLTGLGPIGTHGNLQATAVDSGPDAFRCKIVKWGQSAADQYVVVGCFDGNNRPRDDVGWTLSYSAKTPVHGSVSPPDHYAYLWSDLGGTMIDDYNSVGSLNAVAPLGGGQYEIVHRLVGYRQTTIQVTAIGSDEAYCVLTDLWKVSVPDVFAWVSCWDGFGNPAKSGFFESYTSAV